MKGKKTECIYCEEVIATNEEKHFESDCCGRGMCGSCFDNLQGTEEQLQVDYCDDVKLINKLRRKFGKDISYICYDCIK